MTGLGVFPRAGELRSSVATYSGMLGFSARGAQGGGVHRGAEAEI
jgi:hypothetical protein